MFTNYSKDIHSVLTESHSRLQSDENCLMTKAELFKDLGGFNEQDLAAAFNDVDFCLRLREKNLLIVYTPYAELYHYESLSRGSVKTE